LLICFFYGMPTVAAWGQLRLELGFDRKNNLLWTTDPGIEKAAYSNLDIETWGDFKLRNDLPQSPGGDGYLSLNGIQQYFQIPERAGLQVSGNISFSISMWLRVPAGTQNGDIISSDNGFINGYRLFLEDGMIRFEIRDGTKEIFSSNRLLMPNQWQHIGVVCDGLGDSVTFFVNGASVASHPFTRVVQVQSGTQTYIGTRAESSFPNYLYGDIDDFRFFSGHDTIFEYIRTMPERDLQRLSLKRPKTTTPSYFTLYQNYPNPFNMATRIDFEMIRPGSAELQIFDLLGNMMKPIFTGELSAGRHTYTWDGTDNNNTPVSSGIYFARLTVNGIVQTKKMVLIK
ncbi:MAG TPA: FlgD immunoglobulin-like domain containing protein, partial [bacterium]|nr:FlgD immunoglobulin-like domain containing protein [bacterium]